MIHYIGLLLLLITGFIPDGNSDGRTGNEAFVKGDFQSAAEAYQRGLMTLPDDPEPRIRFGLTNNLGAAQYRLDRAQDALAAFEAAAANAPTAEARALAAYNAGNAAFKAQDLQRALAHYRRALLENPDDPKAKFNYEFVKRQLQEQGGGQQQEQRGDQQQQQDQQQGDNESQQNQDQGQGQEGEQEQEEEGQQQPDQGEQQNEGEQQEGSGDEGDSGEEEPQQDGTPQSSPTDLSREEAERILQALENDEADLLREVQRMDARPRRVEKDW